MIKDKKILEDYLNNLHKDEYYFMCKYARKKHIDYLPVGEVMFEKAIMKPGKLFNILMETDANDYNYKGTSILRANILTYISANPVNVSKLNKKFIHYLIDADNEEIVKPQVTNYYSMTMKCPKREFIHYDIDTTNKMGIMEFIIQSCADFSILIETKNGFHLLLNIKKLKTNYNNIINAMLEEYVEDVKEIKKLSVKSKEFINSLMPLPGCSQIDFIPKIVYSYENR